MGQVIFGILNKLKYGKSEEREIDKVITIVDKGLVLRNGPAQQTRFEFWAVALAVWQRQHY